MKNSLKKIILTFVLSLTTALGAFVGFFPAILPRSVSQETQAADVALYGSTTLDASIYMREPTFSVLYDNKIYFIDNGDKMLKIYDVEAQSFDSIHKPLSDYTILDVCFCDGELYLLTNNQTHNSVIKIKLDTSLSISEFSNLNLNLNYDKFSVSSTSISEVNYTVFTFFSSDLTKNIKPSFALYDITKSKLKIGLTEIGFASSSSFSSNNEGIASMMFYSTTNKNSLSTENYFLFLYENNIILHQFDDFSADFTNIHQNINTPEKSTSFVKNSNEKITKTGFLKIDDVDYLLVSCEENDLEKNSRNECVKVYELSLDSQISITEKKDCECTNSKYAIANDNYISYTNTSSQTLTYIEFTKSSSNSEINDIKHDDIENPECKIYYYETDDFEYKKVTSVTEIYANPWGLSTNIYLGVNVNVVKIGYGQLLNDTEISGFDYCMYTNSNGNHFGYIESKYLEKLEKKSIESAGFKATSDENGARHFYASLWPNASLYSLPTTIQSGKINSSNLTAERIMQIEDNSFVDVLDVLCDYSAGDVKMFKVKVNGDKVGFIEARCVRTPADIVNFVITNATIKNDGTKVYLNANSNSATLPFTLNSGKTVRINGKRDTKTGFTSITFNDEYGNEYSGYIETDYIKADSWSTLQIVGCILIAINIGLLILILIFKKNHLGSHGQKVGEDEVITK